VAEKRMFAKTVVESDAFMDMPQSTQLLYFHLSMHADDDGFVNSPKRIMREVGCKDDDLRLLVTKAFIIPFETGVIVIKHWRLNNFIRSDRYKKTDYIELLDRLEVKDNGAYTLKNGIENSGIPNDNQRYTQNRLDKIRVDKSSIDYIQPEATSSSAQKQADCSPIFISLSLISGKDYNITTTSVNALKPLYPAVDVESELRKMAGWLLGNPKNRKTERGIMRFITGWLAKAQDRAKSSQPQRSANPFLEDLQKSLQNGEEPF
jgi:hypothetical protein